MDAPTAIARGWKVLAAASIAVFLVSLDVTIVNIAFTKITEDFDTDRAHLSWVLSGYNIAFAACLQTAGRLADRFGWRGIFFVNMPACIVAYLCGRRLLVESRDHDATGLPDVIGAALATGAVVLLVLGIVQGDTWGWSGSKTVASFALGALVLVTFIVRSRMQADPVLAGRSRRSSPRRSRRGDAGSAGHRVLRHRPLVSRAWPWSRMHPPPSGSGGSRSGRSSTTR